MTERPSPGTVTFLFTDIEGSTGLVRALRDRYGEVLDQHRRILRAAWRSLAPSVAEGIDAVFIARESIQGAKTQDLEPEMRELLRRSGAMRS